MPIVKSDKSKETEKVKFLINSALIAEIRKYCEWAGVEDIAVFFEQASKFVLKKDSEWKKTNKNG
jgi:hypothetical protein